MSYTRTWSDEELWQARENRELVCQCWRPRREWIGLFDTYQCRTCGKLVNR